MLFFWGKEARGLSLVLTASDAVSPDTANSQGGASQPLHTVVQNLCSLMVESQQGG